MLPPVVNGTRTRYSLLVSHSLLDTYTRYSISGYSILILKINWSRSQKKRKKTKKKTKGMTKRK